MFNDPSRELWFFLWIPYQKLTGGSFLKVHCGMDSETMSTNFHPVPLKSAGCSCAPSDLSPARDSVMPCISQLETTSLLSSADLLNAESLYS